MLLNQAHYDGLCYGGMAFADIKTVLKAQWPDRPDLYLDDIAVVDPHAVGDDDTIAIWHCERDGEIVFLDEGKVLGRQPCPSIKARRK